MKRALTKTQAAELLRAASVLPPAQRDQFLAAVDARLCSLPHRLNDGDVQGAIVAVLADSSITTTHCFMCDAQPKEPTMAPRKSIRIDMRTGREIEDDDGPLKDGQKIVVPLMMCDAKQREVTEHFEGLRAEDAVWLNAALHRPGQRFAVDAAARAHVEEVYQDEKRKLKDAWRQPVATGEFRGAQEGDVCTMREGGVAEGSPGHLRMVTGKLTCVPDQRSHDAVPRVMDADTAQRIKDDAYAEMVNELVTAWQRKPVGESR